MTTNDLDQAREWPAGTADKMNEWAESQLGFSLEPWQMDRLRQWEAPQPRTLADMTIEEREACQWMQADYDGARVVLTKVTDEVVSYLWPSGIPGTRSSYYRDMFTPLPDLPRMVWPEEQTAGHDDDADMTPEDVKPESSPARPATLTTESELLLAPLGTIIRGPETWDFYPSTKCSDDEWVGANETRMFTNKAEYMAGREWTVLYMPEVEA